MPELVGVLNRLASVVNPLAQEARRKKEEASSGFLQHRGCVQYHRHHRHRHLCHRHHRHFFSSPQSQAMKRSLRIMSERLREQGLVVAQGLL